MSEYRDVKACDLEPGTFWKAKGDQSVWVVSKPRRNFKKGKQKKPVFIMVSAGVPMALTPDHVISAKQVYGARGLFMEYSS